MGLEVKLANRSRGTDESVWMRRSLVLSGTTARDVGCIHQTPTRAFVSRDIGTPHSHHESALRPPDNV
jgi:hypothetical protein